MPTFLVILIGLAAAGAMITFVAVRGLVKKRATVYSGRWLLAIVAMGFLPQLLSSLRLARTFPAGAAIGAVIYAALMWLFWYVTGGVVCFGVSEELGTVALRSSLDRLGLKYEQQLSSVRLEDGGVLQVSVQDWFGTMQIRPKNAAAAPRMPALVREVSRHLDEAGAGVRYLPYWMYLFFGAMMLGTLLVVVTAVARYHHPGL